MTITTSPSFPPARRPRGLSRRALLRGAGIGIGSLITAPFIRPATAATRTLKIATFGGNFENGFRKFLFPAFEKATGISVDSVPQPADLGFLMQVVEANRIGAPPVDLATMAQQDVLRGVQAKAWRRFDTSHIPNIKNLPDRYVHREGDDTIAIGGMAWYQTLIVNPDKVKPLPTSWKVLWEPGHPNAWGLASGGGTTLFEITAGTWFSGNDILASKDGIVEVVAKIAELKSNVKVWWESEGTMQTAYENDEIIGGMYYHDVAGVMAKSGISVVSLFPQEGGVIDFGSWCQPSASTKVEEAEAYIDFICTPEAQALIARHVGSAPLIDRKLTDLTDAEFAAVSSDTPPLQIAVEARAKYLDFMDEQFTKMLTS